MWGRGRRTAAGPGDGACAQAGRPVLVDLEPDGALAVESGGGLARGDLGQVEVERAGVLDGGVDREGDGAAGFGRDDLGRAGANIALVAGHGRRGDVLDGTVGLVVRGDADGFPVGGEHTVDRGLGECVLLLLVAGYVGGIVGVRTVSLGTGCRQQRNRGGELHCGGWGSDAMVSA